MERFHRECAAYVQPVHRLRAPKLLSLKVELLALAGDVRRFVDATLLDGDTIVALPFIRIDGQGTPIFHELHREIGPAALEAVGNAVRDWISKKKTDANLEADLFASDAQFQEAVVESGNASMRVLPGMSPYQMVFSEWEQYANVTPYVAGRRVTDFNPGFGFGISTLRSVAATAIAARGTRHPLAARLHGYVDEASADKEPDVAIFLSCDEQHLEATLRRMREAHPQTQLLISARAEGGRLALESVGARVVKMVRPGCDALGPLNEWLGIFDARVTAAAQSKSGSASGIAGTPASVAPRPLRILFALRPTSAQVFGGDVVQVRETAAALRARGHEVEISTQPQLDAKGFDVVHLTNITVPPETLPQARSVATFEGAVVMMPIFTDHSDETVWGMYTTLGLFASAQDAQDLDEKLKRLEERSIAVGTLQPPPQRNDIVAGYTPAQKEILRYVDYFIANAHSEMHRLYRYLNCEIPYTVAPSCANALIYGEHAARAFRERYAIDDFVLVPGRYEPRKNHLLIFEALRALNLPALFIGANHEANFAQAVRIFRAPGVAYIGHMPESELAGAFAAARVVAVPSWDEVVSLTSLNAAISGASIVLTRNSYEHEYFTDDAEYCDPASVGSISGAIRRAWNSHEQRSERRLTLVERVKSAYTWARSAELTEAAYYRVLTDNPRGALRRTGA